VNQGGVLGDSNIPDPDPFTWAKAAMCFANVRYGQIDKRLPLFPTQLRGGKMIPCNGEYSFNGYFGSALGLQNGVKLSSP